MDHPALDLQQPAEPTVASPVAAINPTSTPAQPSGQNHPSYAEMITTAIATLKERNGSSKRAIANYIETNNSNLPSTHASLLSHHLKRLKSNGQILMVKHSYKLPRSTPPAANNAASSDPASAGTKRRPGRPRKTGTDTLQAAVPVFAPEMDMNAVPVADPADEAPQGGIDAANGTIRGRGRPPKLVGFRPKPGRPAKEPTGSRSKGRPRKNPITDNITAQEKGSARPRGRPPKAVNSAEFVGTLAGSGGVDIGSVPVVGDGVSPVTGKRRGRPPKAGGGQAKRPRGLNAEEPKSLRKLSGKPLGRPRKNALAVVNPTPDSQLLVDYLDLKEKFVNLQSRVAHTATVIRPLLNNEAAIHALEELQLLTVNVNVPPNAQE